MGVEPTSIGLQPIAVPSGSSVMSVSSPGIEPGPRPSQSRVRIQHTPRTCCLSVPHQGVEPRLTVPKTAVRPSHSQGMLSSSPSRNRTWSNSFGSCHAIQHTHEPNSKSIPTWNRTRTKTLGESCAVRYTIGTKSRRLDSHQHETLYKSGAFLHRATSASSTSARSRTLSARFGSWLLSQEHTRIKAPEPRDPGAVSLHLHCQFGVPVRLADELRPAFDPHVVSRVKRLPRRPNRLLA